VRYFIRVTRMQSIRYIFVVVAWYGMVPTLRRITVPYFRTQKPEQPGRDMTTSAVAVDGDACALLLVFPNT
jgi:hypothetical protein